jgi:hypothetical protein
LVNVPWTVDFTVTAGCAYIADETAQATLYLPHRRIVRDAVITFENVHDSAGASFLNRPLLQPEINDSTLVEPTAP